MAEWTPSLMEKELDEMYKEVNNQAIELSRSARWRRRAAYTLKAVAAGGGLFVATGLFPHVHQAAGIAVLIAVSCDSLFSNHDRLMAEVEAGYAFAALASRVRRAYNRDASPHIERLKMDENDSTAKVEIGKLMTDAHKQLDAGLTDIKKYLHDKDAQALRNLSLETERAGAQKKT